MLSIHLHSAYLLFDNGATFSCINNSFVNVHGICVEPMPDFLFVNIPPRSGKMLNLIGKGLDIEVEDRHLPTDLVVLDMVDFDVILGVDWLFKYRVVTNCGVQDA